MCIRYYDTFLGLYCTNEITIKENIINIRNILNSFILYCKGLKYGLKQQ